MVTMMHKQISKSKTPSKLEQQGSKMIPIILLVVLISFISSSNLSYAVPTTAASLRNVHFRAQDLHENGHEIPHFRMLNRRKLIECPLNVNPYLKITTNVGSSLLDDQNVIVTVSGVLQPSEKHWVAMISPSHSSVKNCLLNTLLYKETGDFSSLPLLCHYPVKAAYLKSDGDYLACKNSECKEKADNGGCLINTCSASLTFHVINIRTDIEFVLFANGFDTPCILKRTDHPLPFATPNNPLYPHLSSVDSTATAMRVTWVSGSIEPQQVQYGNSKSKTSSVTTFTQAHMCGNEVKSPAQDFGWHNPGFIHSAVMTGLTPSTIFSYKLGSDSVGWSDNIQFRTPPSSGSDELRFLAFGDMGKAPQDGTVEHYIQPGSISVAAALTEEVASGNVDSVFHIGDISYATGFLVEWDYFLHQITPFASRLSYMTAIGNHERDYIDSGSVYITPDSGGECGVPYETYFQMPTSAKDKPWYSIEQGPVHFTVISTEHDWNPNSEQYKWMKSDMASVNRATTPWLIFTGHRPMYTSLKAALLNIDPLFVNYVEPLLLQNKVDLALFGHVHNYERTCAIYKGKCKAMPIKDQNGIDTYNNSNYTAPVQAVIGMAGFTLDPFSDNVHDWSLSRISKFGYTRIQATKKELKLEFVNSNTRQVEDSFRLMK
ncbi:putative inactive purple acid phosphatase 27 isoform X1 [Silene latifolia]|uniref:putative inactive purple acid phosphatase 27 isoform X1 n=1 Tax=Silene latifolia TaxID=37657 RepID=UPI003D78862F